MPGREKDVYDYNLLMDIDSINFTQKSACKTFSDKSKPSLLDTMKNILLGYTSINDFPNIRVAINDENGEYYTIDHRRLLMYKVLRIKEVHVKWINWTREFDCKIMSTPKPDPDGERVNLDCDGIKNFRKELVWKLFSEVHRDGRNLKFTINELGLGYTITPDGGIHCYSVQVYETDSDSDEESESSSEESDDDDDDDDYYHHNQSNWRFR